VPNDSLKCLTRIRSGTLSGIGGELIGVFYICKNNSLLKTATRCFVAYGISDEWHQSFVVGREVDSLDWVADTFGAALAMFLLARFYPYQKLH
jgi:VanZ family protein